MGQVRVKALRKDDVPKMIRIQLEVKSVTKGTERRKKVLLTRKGGIQRTIRRKRKEDIRKMKRRIQSMRRKGRSKPWKVRKGCTRQGKRRKRRRKSGREKKSSAD